MACEIAQAPLDANMRPLSDKDKKSIHSETQRILRAGKLNLPRREKSKKTLTDFFRPTSKLAQLRHEDSVESEKENSANGCENQTESAVEGEIIHASDSRSLSTDTLPAPVSNIKKNSVEEMKARRLKKLSSILGKPIPELKTVVSSGSTSIASEVVLVKSAEEDGLDKLAERFASHCRKKAPRKSPILKTMRPANTADEDTIFEDLKVEDEKPGRGREQMKLRLKECMYDVKKKRHEVRCDMYKEEKEAYEQQMGIEKNTVESDEDYEPSEEEDDVSDGQDGSDDEPDSLAGDAEPGAEKPGDDIELFDHGIITESKKQTELERSVNSDLSDATSFPLAQVSRCESVTSNLSNFIPFSNLRNPLNTTTDSALSDGFVIPSTRPASTTQESSFSNSNIFDEQGFLKTDRSVDAESQDLRRESWLKALLNTTDSRACDDEVAKLCSERSSAPDADDLSMMCSGVFASQTQGPRQVIPASNDDEDLAMMCSGKFVSQDENSQVSPELLSGVDEGSMDPLDQLAFESSCQLPVKKIPSGGNLGLLLDDAPGQMRSQSSPLEGDDTKPGRLASPNLPSDLTNSNSNSLPQRVKNDQADADNEADEEDEVIMKSQKKMKKKKVFKLDLNDSDDEMDVTSEAHESPTEKETSERLVPSTEADATAIMEPHDKKEEDEPPKLSRVVLDDDDDDDTGDEDGEEDVEGDSEGDEEDEGDLMDDEAEESGTEEKRINPELLEFRNALKEKVKVSDFFENEAELSGSEIGSGDEDEGNLDEYDREGIDDNLGISDAQLRDEVGRIYHEDVLGEEQRDLRLLKEVLIGDEEEDGMKRIRTFKWADVDENDMTLFHTADSDDEGNAESQRILFNDQDAVFSTDIAKLRLEKEEWMSSQQAEIQDEEAESSQFSCSMKLVKIRASQSASAANSQSCQAPEPSKPPPISTVPAELSTIPITHFFGDHSKSEKIYRHSSFLERGERLSQVAVKVKDKPAPASKVTVDTKNMVFKPREDTAEPNQVKDSAPSRKRHVANGAESGVSRSKRPRVDFSTKLKLSDSFLLTHLD